MEKIVLSMPRWLLKAEESKKYHISVVIADLAESRASRERRREIEEILQKTRKGLYHV